MQFSTSDKNSGLTIEIKMSKRLLEQDHRVLFEFTVKLRDKSIEYKVMKTYNEFVELE
ncbi:MAG: hypothetical protein ACMG6E_10290 [Candidatus Roizmanbacteria bacterium]|jgi:hypothetical protein